MNFSAIHRMPLAAAVVFWVSLLTGCTDGTTPGVGTPSAPTNIKAMPFSSNVGSTASSYYTYTTIGRIDTITASALTGDIDPLVYTDSSFSTLNANWTCTTNTGTTADSCKATTPVSAGTTLYFMAKNFTGGTGATFTLDVAAPPPEGAPNAPVTILTMPYYGFANGTSSNYYAYSIPAGSSVGRVSLSGLTSNVDLQVYSDAAFTTLNTSWTCSTNPGTTTDDCTATTPVSATTLSPITLYIKAVNLTGGTGTALILNVSSQGIANSPATITMPHSGWVYSTTSSYYSYITTLASTKTITASALTANIDPQVYPTAAFATPDTNWTCTTITGAATDTCTATTAVPVGTTLYIRAANTAGVSATFTLTAAP